MSLVSDLLLKMQMQLRSHESFLRVPVAPLPSRPSSPSPGKNWHETRKAFRPTSGQTSYEKRAELRKNLDAVKAKEKEMKDEKEAERQVRGETTHGSATAFAFSTADR